MLYCKWNKPLASVGIFLFSVKSNESKESTTFCIAPMLIWYDSKLTKSHISFFFFGASNVSKGFYPFQVIHTGIEELIVSASRDKLIKVWKGHSDTPAHVLTGHTLGVSSITSNRGLEPFQFYLQL